jgi:putative ABC transport system ATP-binding protein
MPQNNTSPTSFPVETNDLTKIYQVGRNRIAAVNGISLRITPGEFVTIMGASGSGKSTLLHLLAGLTEPTHGNVKINNVDLTGWSDAARTRFRLDNIGVIFQAFNLIPTLTAEENILLPSLIEGKKRMPSAQLDELLGLLELQERRGHRPDSLSGGEQQRVAIGRALSMNPALILADEPTGNLDSGNSEKLCRLLRELCDKQRRTIVLVTHDKQVASYGDRCVMLKDGQITDHQR